MAARILKPTREQNDNGKVADILLHSTDTLPRIGIELSPLVGEEREGKMLGAMSERYASLLRCEPVG